MALLKLSAPWYIYYKELCVLFYEDREVRIVYDSDAQVINIYVDNQAKADAMTELLPAVKDFGSVQLEINVIPSNIAKFKTSRLIDFANLFERNPIVDNIITVDMMTNTITYIIFRKEVVQYYNDDLGDANGVCSTLYQDIASRVFEKKEGIYFCTNVKDINKISTSCTINTTPAYNTTPVYCTTSF